MTGTAELIVASNRGPVSVETTDAGEMEVRRGGGGLVSGMQAALCAAPHALWVCAALNDGERRLARRVEDHRVSELESVAEAIPGDYELRMLPIDPLTFRQAYNGVANAVLWFLLHMLFDTPQRPIFDAAWQRRWAAYQRYNRIFADALARAAAPGAKVMIQDYHLFLAPRMLREARPDLRIAHFTHVPWVSPDYYRMLPDATGRGLLDGLLGADLIGFHTERWAGLFGQCCEELLGDTPQARLKAFPLAVEPDELRARAHERDVADRMETLRESVGDRTIIGRVDRAELSKNALRGLVAYRELLRRHPEWCNRVVHVVYNYPSREDLPEYREYLAAVERMARAIDDEFGTDEWSPVVMEISNDYPASLAALRMTDVVFVNSVRDGMNLVVLEAVVLSEHQPAVVLSREAGAADLLGSDALLVNPFDVSATAEALHQALSMPAEQRVARSERMLAAATGLPPEVWFQAQVDALGD